MSDAAQGAGGTGTGAEGGGRHGVMCWCASAEPRRPVGPAAAWTPVC